MEDRTFTLYAEWLNSYEGGEPGEWKGDELMELADVLSSIATDYGRITVYEVRIGAIDHGAGSSYLIEYADNENLHALDQLYEDEAPLPIVRSNRIIKDPS